MGLTDISDQDRDQANGDDKNHDEGKRLQELFEAKS
jgi:hypothetical protein